MRWSHRESLIAIAAVFVESIRFCRIVQGPRAAFGLDFYTELVDLPRILEVLPSPGNTRSAGAEESVPSGDGGAAEQVAGNEEESSDRSVAPARDPSLPFLRRFRALHERLVELVDDFSLVGFLTLNIQVCWG